MILSATSVQQKDGHDTSKPLLNGIKINNIVPPPPVQPGGKAENYPRGNRGVCVRSDTGRMRATCLCVMDEGPVRVRVASARRGLFFGHLERHTNQIPHIKWL